MQSERPEGKCAEVAAGAVSVVPHEVVTATGWSAAASASRSSSSHTCWGSAAAAKKTIRKRRKNVSARAGSALSRGTSSAYPTGTLKNTVGAASPRLRSVRSIRPGAGRPSSIYRLPPLYSTMPTLWLPPKVWLHGSQSSSTGGCSVRNGHTCSIACWLAHSIRCVVITALGSPVDPEVNRSLATVSGPAPDREMPPPGPGAAAARSCQANVPPPPVSVTINGSPGGSTAAHASRTAASAGTNAPASSAKTTAGHTSATIFRSFSWSLLCCE